MSVKCFTLCGFACDLNCRNKANRHKIKPTMMTRFFACSIDQRAACARRNRMLASLTLLFLFLAAVAAACTTTAVTPTGNAAAGGPILSENGHFLVSYAAEAPPITLNALHAWLLTVQTPAGEPIDGAVITVDGGMPAHRHGLPTQPQAAPGDAPGQYRIEGVRFQMPGEWIVTFTIAADDLSDQVTFPLTLP